MRQSLESGHHPPPQAASLAGAGFRRRQPFVLMGVVVQTADLKEVLSRPGGGLWKAADRESGCPDQTARGGGEAGCGCMTLNDL